MTLSSREQGVTTGWILLSYPGQPLLEAYLSETDSRPILESANSSEYMDFNYWHKMVIFPPLSKYGKPKWIGKGQTNLKKKLFSQKLKPGDANDESHSAFNLRKSGR